MSASIVTKYLPVTNHRGSRIKATAKAGTPMASSITVDYHTAEGRDAFEKHAHVARLLAERLNWRGHWLAGDLGGASYVFVRSGGGDFNVE